MPITPHSHREHSLTVCNGQLFRLMAQVQCLSVGSESLYCVYKPFILYPRIILPSYSHDIIIKNITFAALKREDSVAQLVEHLPFKERVLGSSPSRITKRRVVIAKKDNPLFSLPKE